MTITNIQRIKEVQGFDPVAKKPVVFWKVFYLDAQGRVQTKIVKDKAELEALS